MSTSTLNSAPSANPMTSPAHECTSTASDGWNLLAACPEDGSGSGTVIGIVVGVVVLAAVGVGIWWLVKKRHM